MESESFISYYDAAERNAGEALKRSQKVALKTLLELYRDIPKDKLIKQPKSPFSSQYYIKNDAHYRGTSNGTCGRTEAPVTERLYWFKLDAKNDPCLNRFVS